MTDTVPVHYTHDVNADVVVEYTWRGGYLVAQVERGMMEILLGQIGYKQWEGHLD